MLTETPKCIRRRRYRTPLTVARFPMAFSCGELASTCRARAVDAQPRGCLAARRRTNARTRESKTAVSAGFHQDRLSASPERPPNAGVPLHLTVRWAPVAASLPLTASSRQRGAWTAPLAEGAACPPARCRREAASVRELEAAAVLRAKSFYSYPRERKFAGEVRRRARWAGGRRRPRSPHAGRRSHLKRTRRHGQVACRATHPTPALPHPVPLLPGSCTS